MTAPAGRPAPLLPDIRLLLYLFVGFRLVMLIIYPPQLVSNGAGVFDRGLTVYGDFLYHFGIAENSRLGLLPYRDFWFEYPPVIALLSLAAYALSGPHFSAYANLLALALIAFDAGNLLLMRRIGAALYGDEAGTALAWIYALMVAPFVLIFWNFEAVVTFSVLLAVACLLARRDNPAALAIALGALTKLVPLAVLGAVWRFRPRAAALRLSGIAAGLASVGFAGVLLVGPEYGPPSLTAQFGKASYQTIWALIDGNYITGVFDDDRLDPASVSASRGNPAVVPWWLRTVIFGAVGLFLFATTRRRDGAGLVAFVALTIVVVYLWSPGWSTQWQALLVPLILLTLPTRGGVLLALTLAVFSFTEYPLLFASTAEANGVLAPSVVPLLALTVLARTALLVGFGAVLYRQLRQEAAP